MEEHCQVEQMIESMKVYAKKKECSRNIPSVRYMLLFRLTGGVHLCLKQLTQQYQELCFHPSTSDSPTPSESTLLQILQLIHDFSTHYDFCFEFAAIGGHSLLKKLLLVDCSSIIELTEDIIGTITSTGCTFPTTTINVMSDDDIREGLVLMPTIHEFRDDESTFHIYLRKAPQRMYGNSHERVVGYVLWNSAVILSRWLVTNEKVLIRNKSVLEIGAGLGLCGLVATRYAKAMTLSDWTHELLNNLNVNVGMNSGLELIDGECGSVLPSCTCDVRHLDWSKLPHTQHASPDDQHGDIRDGDDVGGKAIATAEKTIRLADIEMNGIVDKDAVDEEKISKMDEMKPTFLSLEKGRMFDVIIGSDIVYCLEDAINVPNVLWHHLAPSGMTLRHTLLTLHTYRYDTKTQGYTKTHPTYP